MIYGTIATTGWHYWYTYFLLGLSIPTEVRGKRGTLGTPTDIHYSKRMLLNDAT